MRLCVICFAAGVWLLQVQSSLPEARWYWLTAPLLVIAALAVAPIRTWRSPRVILSAAACAALGFLWSAWLAQNRLADALPEQWEGHDIVLVGVIANMPQAYERSVRFEFDVEQVVTPGARAPAHIALSWWGSSARGVVTQAPQLRAGERWRLKVKLRRPHGSLNPHGFDYEAWLLERNIRATGYVRVDSNAARLDAVVARPQYLIERLRENARARIHATLPDARYAGVLVALAIGDQRAIPYQQWQIFTRTGVNHLMSISGLHVTMLSGLVFMLSYALWRRHARLTLWLPARKAATAFGLLTAFAYAWASGFAVPAQRTVFMLTVVAVALWRGRLTSASNVLAAVLFTVLAFDPWAVLAPGFWLSFGAVALILLVTNGRIAQPHWLLAAAQVQWAVTLGLVPLLLALFQQVSLVSPFANAIAIPVVSFVVVPVTLLGLIPGLDLMLHLAHAVMAACGAVLEWMSGLSTVVWQQHAPSPWAVAVAMAGILWLLLPRGFPARWLGAIALLPLFLVKPALIAPGDLKLTVLDVGQGLAVVAQTREHALLYDTGPSYGPQSDSGNRVIVPYLRASGVRRLSGLVVSHDDSDHSGGAASVLQAVPVDTLTSSLPPAHPLLALVTSSERCQSAMRWEWDQVQFEILYPSKAAYAREKYRDNDRGCVLRIATAKASVLLTADIEQRSERELLRTSPDQLRAEVLVVPHHGSGTSSSAAFLEKVKPQVALIAVGYRNRFGHPKEEVLDRYREIGSRIYRTDHDGALLVSIAADGRIEVSRYRALYRRYWHAPLENPDLPDDEPQPAN